MWFELHEIMLVGFQQHYNISPMERNLRLEDPKMIKKLNDTLHTSFSNMIFTRRSNLYITELDIYSHHISCKPLKDYMS